MKIDKPLVSILLAMYKPNEKWLIEQLMSLNAQSYSNVEIIIWDDCPAAPADKTLIARCLTNFPYTLIVGEKNLGSNGAFEELTKLAKGKYVSYCDQDDVWNHDKVAIMVERLERTDSPLVCSDLYIIDENTKRVADSITDIRKRHVFREGEGLAKHLIIRNFIVGCAMAMKTSIAQKAIPFEPYLVHDQWLGIMAALHGRIEVIHASLIGHRQHECNQTGILTGVTDKESYYNLRLVLLKKRVDSLSCRLQECDELRVPLANVASWVAARIEYFRKPNVADLRVMCRYRRYGVAPVLLEFVLPVIPQFVLRGILRKCKNVAARSFVGSRGIVA